MIDLTKPIRRKYDGRKPAYVKQRDMVEIDWGSHLDANLVDRLFFEENYENIPEPRKPREWSFHGFCIEGPDLPKEAIRVIEWPEGAPLPEWPTCYSNTVTNSDGGIKT